MALVEVRQALRIDADLDASRDAWLPGDPAGALEGEDHLVDGRRGDAEMALHVGFGGRATEQLRVGVNESEILPLLGGEDGA